MEKKEQFITGVISSHPIVLFSKITESQGEDCVMGFIYKFKTTQVVDYEVKEVELFITSVYDLKRWEVITKGQKLTLSIQRKQVSQYSDTGYSLMCNIVDRKR